MSPTDTRDLNLTFGIASIALAAIALMVSVTHMTIGPFAPQKPVEKVIVDTAVNIKDAAMRAVTGADAPTSVPTSNWDIDRVIQAAALGMAGLAMLIAIVSFVRREGSSHAWVGLSMGGAVMLMAYFQWIALLICGVILLCTIVDNLDSILG